MIQGVKGSKIIDKTFKFDGEKIRNKLVYQGRGKSSQPDKRYDANCEGLALFIYPSGSKVFYAYKWVEMYNHKKGKMEKNVQYKRMFRYQDIQGYKYRDAKDKLKEALDKIKNPVRIKDKKTLRELCMEFYKEGMKGARTKGFSQFNYKPSTIRRYQQYLDSYIFLKHTDKETIKKLTKQLIFRNRISTKPVGDYLVEEIQQWHLEVLRKRLEHIPSSAENAVGMISIVYKWAIENNIYKGKNPAEYFVWTQTRPVKAKLLDEDTAKLKDYIQSKAFDFQPHFLCCVGLHLFTGQRSLDIFGLRWEAPVSEEEKEGCSGWLSDGWDTSNRPTFHLWSMKNHRAADIYLDAVSLELLKRLKEANLREKNKWALKSPFIFPKEKSSEWTWQKFKPVGHVTYSSYQKPLAKLNKLLGFEKLEGDNIPRVKAKSKRKIFTFKIARKTFATEVARNKGGIELAARKLNHTSSSTTRRNYIVPDEDEMAIENLYEKNLPEKDAAIVVKSPWNKKEDIDKK